MHCPPSNRNIPCQRMYLSFVTIQQLMNLRVFSFALQNVYGNIHRVLEIADKLSEVGHYEADRIEVLAASVDSEWKSFDMDVNQRSSLLSCSVAYHHHSEEVIIMLHCLVVLSHVCVCGNIATTRSSMVIQS